jgi:phosphoadenosine phosphosulfate reductase
MRLSYLGKLLLHWCDTCHVPVLSGRCACGADTRSVPVTPPGDIRLAFNEDCRFANRLYDEYFGAPLIPEGEIVLLNKVPDKDRMDELIIGGAVVSAIRYLPERGAWEPIPRVQAARYCTPLKRYVVIDPGAVESVAGGASVLAPGLVEIHEDVAPGDQVFILDTDGRCVGVGRAKVSAEEALTMTRGVIVRTRKNQPQHCVRGTAGPEDMVAANREVLARVEGEAVAFVRRVAAQNQVPANISYSGGKDSLATLLVVLKAIGPVPMLFADTGMEFEETYENVREVSRRYNLELISTGSGENFWQAFSEEGPPSVNRRWCCNACKLQPVRELIAEQWGECLSFIGQRKYESMARMKSPRVWRNRKVGNQISAAPIQHWTALHVWLYILQEDAPYNHLYARRIDRIGCYMCPSSDLATFSIIKDEFPDKWAEWDEQLQSWQHEHNLPDEWRTGALWRKTGDTIDEESSYT